MSQSIQPARRSLPIRVLRWLALVCLALYLVACAALTLYQRKLIYTPHRCTPAQVDQMAAAKNLERWKNPAGDAIGLKRPSPRQPAVGSVLVLYGNGGYAAGCAHYADAIQSAAALDVFILEYPGYGDRPGPPSEAALFGAADEALALLDTNKPIYVLGESLGTGVAAHLAGTYPGRIAGEVLLSPFNRLTAVAQHRYPIFPAALLLVDNFPSEDLLRDYHGPVGVVADGRDRVVPEKFGLRLYTGYNGPKKLWEFPDGGHCQIKEPLAKFWGEAVQFWQSNRSSPK